MREIAYLSPSSLDELEQNPVRFYLHRIGPEELRPPKEPQTLPMAIGTWFDILVKDHLAKGKGWAISKDAMIEQSLESEEHRNPAGIAATVGKHVFMRYLATPAIGYLLEEGLAQVELHPETRVVAPEMLAGRPAGGVPISGRPDAVIRKKDGTIVILDWKVTGAASERGASPEAGYCRMFVGGEDTGPHLRSFEYLEAINAGWAKQLAMYAWQLGAEPGDAIVGGIEQCVCGPPAPEGREVRVCQYRLPIGKAFQLKLVQRLRDAWARIKEGRVLPPELQGKDPAFLSMLV